MAAWTLRDDGISRSSPGHFGVAKRAVPLIAGDTARLKRLQVAGDPHALAKIAASLYEVVA